MITSPELNLVFPAYSHKVKKKEGKLYILEEITKKYRLLTPEEWVRQHCLQYLVNELNYPASLFQIEGSMKVDQLNRRTDIRVYNAQGDVFMLIECKAPSVGLNQQTWFQLLDYNQTIQAKYGLISNGIETQLATFDSKIGSFNLLNTFPKWDNA